MNFKKVFIINQLLLLSLIGFAQMDFPVIIAKVSSDDNPLSQVLINIKNRQQEKIESIYTGEDGKATISLKAKNIYFIEFASPGYISSIVKVNTTSEKESPDYFPFEFEIELLEYYTGINTDLFNSPVLKISYDDNSGLMTINEEHRNTVAGKIEEVKEDLYNLKFEAYKAMLKKADKILTLNEYEDAWLIYSEALLIMPGQPYPNKKIKEIKEKILESKSFNLAYAEMIEKADQFYANNKDLAKNFYRKALLYRPNDEYAQQKIKVIDEELMQLNLLKKQAYQNKIEKADNLFKNGLYEKAKEVYNEALILQKEENYPKQKINEITKILSGEITTPNNNDNTNKENTQKETIEEIKPEKVTENTISNEYQDIPAFKLDTTQKNKEIKALQLKLNDESIKDLPKKQAAIQYEMGVLNLQMGKLNESVRLFNIAIEKYTKEGDEKKAATVKKDLATAYAFEYRYTEAIKELENIPLSILDEDNKLKSEIYSTMAKLYAEQSDTEKSIEYYQKSVEADIISKNKKGVAAAYNNMGVMYYDQGDFEKAVAYFEKSLKAIEKTGNTKEVSIALNNIGNVNYDWQKFKKALEYYNRSLDFKRKLNYQKGIVNTLYNIGNVYYNLNDYNNAIEYYKNSLMIAERSNFINAVSLNNKALAKVYAKQNNYKKAYTYLNKFKTDVENVFSGDKIEQLSELQHKYEIEAGRNQNKIAMLEEQLARQSLLTRYQNDKKQKELEILQKQKQLQQLELDRDKIIRYSMLGGFILLAIILIVVYNRYRLKQRANKKMRSAHKIILEEKNKSEKLLLNILPQKVADELKVNGKVNPELFPNVSVMFADIVAFTKASTQMPPKKLIEELNEIFTRFDTIMEKHSCERIKTMGDAYMAVCGMPVKNERPTRNMVRAAMEIMEYWRNEILTGELKWQIRIGIHTGEVIGGVVGVKKYIYDVFGDTINTASRMQSHSEPGKINVTEKVVNDVKEEFEATYRGEFEAKGKGLLKMYFLSPNTSKKKVNKQILD